METELVTKIDAELDKQFRTQSAEILTTRRKEKRPVKHWIVSRKEDGAILAGCRSMLWQGWLTIDSIWVDPAERGKGRGADLLRKKVELARSLGAKGLDASLYAAENADFFIKNGFEIFASLPGADEGLEKLWLVKSFQPLASPQPAAQPDARRSKRDARKAGALPVKRKAK